MARLQLTVNDITRAGALFPGTYAQTLAIADGAKYRNSGREWLRIGNASGGNATITIPIPRLLDGAAVASKSYTLANNSYFYLPPFPTDTYNYSDEMVYINTTAIVTAIVWRDGS
jgi:hypothetical protein